MSCVLLFNQNSIHAYYFRHKKKAFVLEKSETFDNVAGNRLVQEPEDLREFLFQHFQKEKNRRFYLLIDGLDIQYRTVPYSGADLGEDMDDRRKEEAVLMAAKLNLPKEVTELHEGYTACIMNAYANDLGFTMSLAFIPGEYLSNIRYAFQQAGLNLTAVSPRAYGLYNALVKAPELLAFNDKYSLYVFGESGIYCWPKPKGCQIEEEEILNNVSDDARRALDAPEAEIINLDEQDLYHYVKNTFNFPDTQAETDCYSILGFGALLPYSEDSGTAAAQAGEQDSEDSNNEDDIYSEEENTEERKGFLANVTGKLRQLFNRSRTEDSEAELL